MYSTQCYMVSYMYHDPSVCAPWLLPHVRKWYKEMSLGTSHAHNLSEMRMWCNLRHHWLCSKELGTRNQLLFSHLVLKPLHFLHAKGLSFPTWWQDWLTIGWCYRLSYDRSLVSLCCQLMCIVSHDQHLSWFVSWPENTDFEAYPTVGISVHTPVCSCPPSISD